MPGSPRILPLLLSFALLGVAAAPAGAETQLAAEQRAFTASAVGDTVVWSSFDPAAEVYRLVTLRDGAPVTLPVPPSAEAFDVDVGTNRSGTPVAVYSRCTQPAPSLEPPTFSPRGCDVYRYYFASGTEQRLTTLSSPTADETQPTAWRGEIAFVRRNSRGTELRIGNTTRGARGTRRLTLLRAASGRIADPQLTLKRIAYVVDRRGRREFAERVVHVLTLRTRRDRAIYTARSGGANFANVTRPSWSGVTGTSLYFARTNQGSGTGNRFLRWSPRTGRFAYAAGDRQAISTTWLGGRSGMLVSTDTGGGDCGTNPAAPPRSRCRLYTSGPLRFGPRP